MKELRHHTPFCERFIPPGTQGKFSTGFARFRSTSLHDCYLLASQYDVVYTRELPAWVPNRKTVCELHTISPIVSKNGCSVIQSRGIVVITEGIRSELISLGVSTEHILVAADGVDLDDFSHSESKEAARKRLDCRSTERLRSTSGDLIRGKELILYTPLRATLAHHVRVVIMGEGEKSLKELQQTHPSIIFLGFRQYRELADNQAAADVLRSAK